MATPATKRKTAMESLTDSFDELVSQARKEMPAEDLRRAEEEFDQIVTKVRASRGRRRETA
jgi:hypothetical protein